MENGKGVDGSRDTRFGGIEDTVRDAGSSETLSSGEETLARILNFSGRSGSSFVSRSEDYKISLNDGSIRSKGNG